MKADDEEGMNKAERLAAAGYAAPRLRDGSEVNRARRVKLYRQETGEVTGFASLAESQKQIFERAKIEFAVVGPDKAHREICNGCGQFFSVKGRRGAKRKTCDACLFETERSRALGALVRSRGQDPSERAKLDGFATQFAKRRVDSL